MANPLVKHLQSPAWAAGATQQILTDRIPATLTGMASHVVRMDIKVVLSVEDSSAVAVPGADLWDAINLFTFRDVLSNTIIRLRGRHLRTIIKAVKGWRHADPAALPGTDSGTLERMLECSIPFHGLPGGVAGFESYKDMLLPVDRFRTVPIEVEWSAATPATWVDASINSATMYISFVCLPYREPVMGADLRYSFIDIGAAERTLDFPVKGTAIHTAIITNTGRNLGTYTDFTVDELQYLSQAQLWQITAAWNNGTALDVAQHEVITAPEFAPIVFQGRSYNVTGVVPFPTGRMQLQVTSTNALLQELVVAELFDSRELAEKFKGRPMTVFASTAFAKADYAKKNQPRVGGGTAAPVAARLNRLLPQKMRRQ